jgi:hypothetical protein
VAVAPAPVKQDLIDDILESLPKTMKAKVQPLFYIHNIYSEHRKMRAKQQHVCKEMNIYEQYQPEVNKLIVSCKEAVRIPIFFLVIFNLDSYFLF